jgi:hypothetical protein
MPQGTEATLLSTLACRNVTRLPGLRDVAPARSLFQLRSSQRLFMWARDMGRRRSWQQYLFDGRQLSALAR